MDDSKIGEPEERVARAQFWKEKARKLEAAFKGDASVLSPKLLEEYKLMLDYAHHLTEILDLFADIRQPRSFEELMKYGFDDPPA